MLCWEKNIPAHGQASFAAGWRLDMGLSKADTDVDIEQELLNWGLPGAANGSAKNSWIWKILLLGGNSQSIIVG